MTHAELITRALEQGIDHATFAARAEKRAAAVDGSDPYIEYRKLNVARMQRQTKTYVPSDAMRTAMQGITAPQTWVCITEDWCGDSSQTEPIIAAIAALNPHVTYRMLDRDTHPDAMDMYLTNGSRSVPIVVCFDAHGAQQWVWGPRPDAALPLVAQWKTEHEVNSEWYPKLHAWYAQHAHREVEHDLIARMASAQGA